MQRFFIEKCCYTLKEQSALIIKISGLHYITLIEQSYIAIKYHFKT